VGTVVMLTTLYFFVWTTTQNNNSSTDTTTTTPVAAETTPAVEPAEIGMEVEIIEKENKGTQMEVSFEFPPPPTKNYPVDASLDGAHCKTNGLYIGPIMK